MDRKVAEQVITAVDHCIGELIETLGMVEKAASPDDYKAYKRAVARVINLIDLEVVDRVAQSHPDLRSEA